MLSRLLLLCILVFGSRSFINAQSLDSLNNKMIVYGKAKVSQKADQFSFTIKIKGYGPNLQNALENAQKILTDVIIALKSIGYSENEFYTSHFSEGESYDKAIFSSKKDYEVNYSLKIKSDKLDIINSTINKINELKIEITEIDFSLKNEFELTKLALKQAAENARIKAEILFKELNATMEQILFVEEDADSYQTNINYRGQRIANLGQGIVLDGFMQNNLLKNNKNFSFVDTITKTVTVKVIYKIK